MWKTCCWCWGMNGNSNIIDSLFDSLQGEAVDVGFAGHQAIVKAAAIVRNRVAIRLIGLDGINLSPLPGQDVEGIYFTRADKDQPPVVFHPYRVQSEIGQPFILLRLEGVDNYTDGRSLAFEE